jgi:hypothetical protein
MEEALRFFRTYELWIYFLLGLGGALYVRKFLMAWQELRGAGFGLERDSAQARLNGAASILVLLLTTVVIVFILVSFIAPAVPGAVPLLTPTLDMLATPTATLASAAGLNQTPVVAVSGAVGEVPAQPAAATLSAGEGCVPDQVAITHPLEGQRLRFGAAYGTANIPILLLQIRNETQMHLTADAGGNEPKQEGLSALNTSLLSPKYTGPGGYRQPGHVPASLYRKPARCPTAGHPPTLGESHKCPKSRFARPPPKISPL